MSTSARPGRAPLALLAALAATLFASHAARAAGEVSLAWRLEKGSSLHYVLESRQTALQRLAGNEEPFRTHQNETIEYRLSVLDVDPVSGTARVLCRYEAVAIDLEQMMLGKVRWDSRDKDDVARADEPLVKPFARLVGQEFSFLLSPQGDIADVRGLEAVRKTIMQGLEDSPLARLALEGPLADAAVETELERAFAVVPAAPVAPGATWRRAYTQPLPIFGALRYEIGYRLEKVDADLATIAFSVALGAAEARPDPETRVEATLDSGAGAGTAVFHVREGRLESSEGEFRMAVTTRLTPPAAPASGPGSSSATSEIVQKAKVARLPR